MPPTEATVIEGSALTTSGQPQPSEWTTKYSSRHRPIRVNDFPLGVRRPVKVRVYQRAEHYILQWWESQRRRTLTQRVDGDLLDALGQARQIDDRLASFGRSGAATVRFTHPELVQQFLVDATIRADADEIALSSVTRFRSALAHYLAFVSQHDVSAKYQTPASIDRAFAMAFAAFLSQRHVARNGHSRAAHRPMSNHSIVIDVVRAMYEWALDPMRGNLLTSGFANPFRRAVLTRRRQVRELLGEPDITTDMAADFLAACDDHQLRIFAAISFWGLRPSELTFIFHEHVSEQCLRVCCISELAYTTKGLRNKTLPMLPELTEVLGVGPDSEGPIFRSRSAGNRCASLNAAVENYQRELNTHRTQTALVRARIRTTVVKRAGAICYDEIVREFQHVAKSLAWPKSATLKDLRHLCQTNLDNARLSREERQYLLGQSPGTEAITHYVHLNKLREHFTQAVEIEMAPLLAVLRRRQQSTQ